MRNDAQYKKLKRTDYGKLIDLLPAFRFELKRELDDEGEKAAGITLERAAARAIAYIRNMARDDESRSDGERLGIVKPSKP